MLTPIKTILTNNKSCCVQYLVNPPLAFAACGKPCATQIINGDIFSLIDLDSNAEMLLMDIFNGNISIQYVVDDLIPVKQETDVMTLTGALDKRLKARRAALKAEPAITSTINELPVIPEKAPEKIMFDASMLPPENDAEAIANSTFGDLKEIKEDHADKGFGNLPEQAPVKEKTVELSSKAEMEDSVLNADVKAAVEKTALTEGFGKLPTTRSKNGGRRKMR